jgi:hypothetical protein
MIQILKNRWTDPRSQLKCSQLYYYCISVTPLATIEHVQIRIMRCTSYKHSVNIILFSFVFTRLAMTENNFEKVCRICIKEASESVHLFDTKLSDSGTFVVDFLRQITNLEVRSLLTNNFNNKF